MTFEETLQKAQQGDIDAMLVVADTYMKEESEQTVDDALSWFEKVISTGEKGSPQVEQALTSALCIYSIKYPIDIENAAWNYGIIHAAKTFSHATDLLSYDNTAEAKAAFLQYGKDAIQMH